MSRRRGLQFNLQSQFRRVPASRRLPTRSRLLVEPLEQRRLLSAESQLPIAYWNFDDNLLDQTAGGHDLTTSPLPVKFSASVPPQLGSGKSITFAGNNDNARALNFPSVSENEYSVSLWFQTTTPGHGIFENSYATLSGRDRGLWLDGDGSIKSSVRLAVGGVEKTTPQSPPNLADGTWHHVVHTFSDSSNMGQRVYVDGQLVATGTADKSGLTTQDRIYIGRSFDAGTSGGVQNFIGQIDEVVIWNRALVEYEIGALAQGASPFRLALVPLAVTDDNYSFDVGYRLVVPASRGVLANDAGSLLVAEVETPPAYGDLIFDDNGAFIYRPRPAYAVHSTDSFVYRVTDVDGNAQLAQVTIVGDPAPPSSIELFVTTDADEDDGDRSAGDLSLREAVLVANEVPGGATIHVLAGDYYLLRTGSGEDQAFTGDLDLTDPVGDIVIEGAGKDLTRIHGRDDRVFDVHFGLNAVFRNLAILDGREVSGGGLRLNGHASAQLDQLQIADNEALGSGGGIFIDQGAELVIFDLDVIRNTAAEYGGGIDSSIGKLVVRTSTFELNTALSGGAAFVGNFEMTDSIARGNRATMSGGAILIEDGVDGDASAAIRRTAFEENEAPDGGAIAVGTGGLEVDSSSFRQNRGDRGGGVLSVDGIVDIFNSTFTENRVGHGSASQDVYGGGAGVKQGRNGQINIGESYFLSNYADWYGGAVYNLKGTVLNSTFENNSTFWEAGATYGPGVFINSTFFGNYASVNGGAAVSGEFRNCTITNNNADWAGLNWGTGGGVYGGTIINSIVAENFVGRPGQSTVLGDVAGPGTNVSFSLVAAAEPGSGLVPGVNGNLVGTPEAPLDARLGPYGNHGGPTKTRVPLRSSQVVDSGNASLVTVLTDQRGLPRIVEGHEGDSVAQVDMGAVELQPTRITGRHVFYNDSRFDGQNAAVTAADDQAIATDKVALLPGQTATFANYTSYNKGIDGLMIDILDPPQNSLTAGDFQFRVGNSNSPQDWATLNVVPTVSVRTGEGDYEAARVTLIWPAEVAVRKQWLQIVVKANDKTGLTTPDVFYFGNAVGESGNQANDFSVSVIDELLARNNPVGVNPGAAVTNRFDYNRDGTVSVVDQLLARNNITTASSKLKQITVPSLPAGLNLVPQSLDDAISDIARGLIESTSPVPGIVPNECLIPLAAVPGDRSRPRPQAIATETSATPEWPSRHRQLKPGRIDDELLELPAS